jgi:hypothetical protein
MSFLKSLFGKNEGNRERADFKKELANSIESQDNLMLMDVAKVLEKMPEGCSVVAFRKYRGTVLAGVVVANGDIGLMAELGIKGRLNPESSPGLWRLVPESRLKILKGLADPPDAALAFFVLAPSGQYAFAYSHLVRADGNVQWINDAEFICDVADMLLELNLFETDH